MKKFVCVMLSVIMTLSLAACGQTGGPSSESSSSEETAAEETASSAETSAEEAAGSSGSETSSEEAGSGSAQETAGGSEGGRVLVAYGAHDHRNLPGKLRYDRKRNLSVYAVRVHGYGAV